MRILKRYNQLFENNYKKPNEDDEDFAFHWKKWARHEINEKVGPVSYTTNGYYVCKLSGSEFYGYFLVEGIW